jgi:hypothetical protein
VIRAALSAALLLAQTHAVLAATAPETAYMCRAFVTGTDDRDRPGGLARCWAEVLTKVSGDPRPLAAEPVPPPPGAVADFYYLDRMTTEARHDEQGSRDRPYDLVVRFAQGAVEAALADRHETVWASPALRLRVCGSIAKGGAVNPLTASDANDERARHALDDAAQRFGVTLSFAPDDTAAMPVTGRVMWTDAGWTATWTVPSQSGPVSWTIEGASMDAAMRAAVLGARAIASGHAADLGEVAAAAFR